MKTILSPAKTMNYKQPPAGVVGSEPIFLNEAQQLVHEIMKKPNNLAKTLGVSEKIAALNKERFEKWNTAASDSQPAVWAYSGDVYNGLAIKDFSKDDLNFAQEHTRIISGLYGLLRPFDLIQPYRLEMKTRLGGKWGNNLYDFWGDKIAKELTKDDDTVLVCASDEYSKSVLPHLKDTNIITPIFMIDTDNGPVRKPLFSKYTRGVMAKWVAINRIDHPAQLRNFDLEGYKYSESLSKENEPVFVAPKDFTLLGRFTKT